MTGQLPLFAHNAEPRPDDALLLRVVAPGTRAGFRWQRCLAGDGWLLYVVCLACERERAPESAQITSAIVTGAHVQHQRRRIMAMHRHIKRHLYCHSIIDRIDLANGEPATPAEPAPTSGHAPPPRR